ncbi:SRPBCC domain-containing protein [Halomarina rubra]|uniref:SRPBCC family protein n=1 Tax=Halomarina rubra TaxID=2071873 RepID=A0ABD6B0U8_9EURY|nr:SRPBCC domain-containing protein [Halomarina rubra]
MRTIRSETVIDAPPSAVWSVLADLDAYEEWNPHITTAAGDLQEGSRVTISVDQRDRTRTFRPTVTTVDAPRRLQWVGTVGPSWLFEGRHTFDLEPLADDRTLLVNHERLSGLLVRFVSGEEDTAAYESMNWALAERLDRLRTPDPSPESTH